jgi:hypothetical protein
VLPEDICQGVVALMTEAHMTDRHSTLLTYKYRVYWFVSAQVSYDMHAKPIAMVVSGWLLCLQPACNCVDNVSHVCALHLRMCCLACPPLPVPCGS